MLETFNLSDNECGVTEWEDVKVFCEEPWHLSQSILIQEIADDLRESEQNLEDEKNRNWYNFVIQTFKDLQTFLVLVIFFWQSNNPVSDAFSQINELLYTNSTKRNCRSLYFLLKIQCTL